MFLFYDATQVKTERYISWDVDSFNIIGTFRANSLLALILTALAVYWK